MIVPAAHAQPAARSRPATLPSSPGHAPSPRPRPSLGDQPEWPATGASACRCYPWRQREPETGAATGRVSDRNRRICWLVGPTIHPRPRWVWPVSEGGGQCKEGRSDGQNTAAHKNRPTPPGPARNGPLEILRGKKRVCKRPITALPQRQNRVTFSNQLSPASLLSLPYFEST